MSLTPSSLPRRQITSHFSRLSTEWKKASSKRSGIPELSCTITFALAAEASRREQSRSARPLITIHAVAGGDFRSGDFAMGEKDGTCPVLPARNALLLHRVIDHRGVGAFGLLGDDGVGAAGHQRRDGAVVILDVELAVGVAKH